MDELLKSLYVKLDSTAKSLTKDAIGQLLIKIIYSFNDNGLTKKEIVKQYSSLVKHNALSDSVDEIINSLVSSNLILHQHKKYYLSKSKKDKISKSLQESHDRLDYIIDKYFKQLYSGQEIIRDWFIDMMLHFFESYSKIWISDLCYHKNDVGGKIKDIIELLKRRTNNFKGIDKRDYERLFDSFSSMLIANDAKVDDLFWEYGTSQFAAQLINKGNDADQITLDIFSGANCVLDTNILMHIGLEASEYYKHLSTLEMIFEKLNVNVGILNVTKNEYESTIGNKKTEILNLFNSCKLDVIEETTDSYIHTAKKRLCKNQSDYERFFDQLMSVPKYVDKSLKINLFDDDYDIEKAVELAQKDEYKLNQLNSIYKSITGRDKRQNALIHDVGMMAGVSELRKKGKYFILSQESSVNGYAKQLPCEHDLPIAMKIETLINILAVNSLESDYKNYVPLFANIIRMELQPNRDTFKIADLSYIQEKNQQVLQLSSECTIQIAKEVHRKRLLGVDDDELQKDMTRMLQGEKIKIVDEFEQTKRELIQEKEEKEKETERSRKGREALTKKWKEEKEKEIDGHVRNYYICFGVGVIVLGVALFLLMKYLNVIETLPGIISGFLAEIIISIVSYFKIVVPKIFNLKNNKDSEISKYISDKIKETYNE